MAFWGLLYTEQDGFLSPKCVSAQPNGGALELRFDNAGAGLRASDGMPLRGFAVAGADKKFYAARAEIRGGNTVVLTSDSVAAPLYATYAFSNMNMKSNLVNGLGIPALPYRSLRDASAKYFDAHDFLSCDFLEVWRFDLAVGDDYRAGWKPLYSATGAALALDGERAVAGKSLRLSSEGETCALKVHFAYPNERHQLGDFDKLSVWIRTESAANLAGVSVTRSRGGAVELTQTEVSQADANGFVRVTFDVSQITNSVKYIDGLELRFANASGASVWVDCFELSR